MVNKARAQGTAEEVHTVKQLFAAMMGVDIDSFDGEGPGMATFALEDGSGYSDGMGNWVARVDTPGKGMPYDVMYDGRARFRFQIKASEKLPKSPHKLLDELSTRAGNPVVLWWKRVVKKPGNTRRSADGLSRVVIMDDETFLELLRVYERFA